VSASRWRAPVAVVLIAAVALASVFSYRFFGSTQADIHMPSGYRDWRLISVAHEAGDLNDLRAILGNDVAIKAYRAGTLPFPDGAIIARLAWRYVASEENDSVFGRAQSFVPGTPTNVQFMIKDAKKYRSTGGWGFAQFTDGKPADAAALQPCFPCHAPVKDRDFVFTRYAP
jgi:Cytochrome P460